jgi:hypothetical protein
MKLDLVTGLSFAARPATSHVPIPAQGEENKGSHFCRNDKRGLSQNAPVRV